MSGSVSVDLAAGGARRWMCALLAIASFLLMSAPAPAPAATGAPFRDGLFVVVSGLRSAPASLTLRFDQGRARVLSQRLREASPLTGSPLSGAAVHFSSSADGFSLQAVSAQTVARISVGLEVLKPGRPITGGVSLPHGTTIVVAMPNGHQMLLRDGRFSIPTSAVGIGSPVRPELAVEPQRVRPGGAITVTGDVGSRCGIGKRVTLTSTAFPESRGGHTMTAVVLREGGFDVRATIPRTRHRGRYAISAHCAGSGLEVATHVVLTGSHGAVGDSVDDCAPGHFDVYVCATMSNYAFGATLVQGEEWHSCGGTIGALAERLPYPQLTTFKAYCAVDFWGEYDYHFTIPPFNTRGVFVVESYSTFTGNSSCDIYNAGSVLDLSCTAGDGQLLLVNPGASGERGHYDRFAEVYRPKGT
jgi:hypothetical protein